MKDLIFVGFNGYFLKNLSRVSFCRFEDYLDCAVFLVFYEAFDV
jgi:hypothetical protein